MRAISDHDCVIVGGGIAGLTTAVRLAAAGARVMVLEEAVVGTGASTRNQGVLHSGALFSVLHPEVTRYCGDGQKAFAAAFPDAVLKTPQAWYLAPVALMERFHAAWTAQGIRYETVDQAELAETLHPSVSATRRAARIDDKIVASAEVMKSLVDRCARLGVEIVDGTRVKRIVVQQGRAIGVEMARAEVVRSNHTVLACGHAVRDLLSRIGSHHADRVKTRLGTMLGFPESQLAHSVMSLEYGGPCLVPTSRGDVLATRYGAPLTWVSAGLPNSVPAREAALTLEAVQSMVRPGLVETKRVIAWSCGKTEYAAGRQDAWGAEPHYTVIDHSDEGFAGLWTILPGKMTLALHASRDLARCLLGGNGGDDVGLRLPGALLNSDRTVKTNCPASSVAVACTPVQASLDWTNGG